MASKFDFHFDQTLMADELLGYVATSQQQ